jgi:molecular chaperone GrpE
MTSATDPGSTEGTGPGAPVEAEGEAWAKTVIDGVPEGGEAAADPSPGVAEAYASAGGDPGDPPAPTAGDDAGGPNGTISVEDLVADLERVSAERDQYLDTSRRIQAEFENYKKQVAKREAEARERANDSLVGELLPVLDAFDGALASGAEDVAPMRTTILDALAKQGLERIDPDEGTFDPNLHEAVMHEDDAETDGPVVAQVMRAGYVWKGRVLRPAMVKTRG